MLSLLYGAKFDAETRLHLAPLYLIQTRHYDKYSEHHLNR